MSDKPPFDANKPYKVVTSEKSKFTPAQVVIRKYGEGFTGGLSNVLTGAVLGAVNPQKTMGEEIHRLQEESKQISKQDPLLAGASELGGIVTPQGLMGRISGGVTKALSEVKGASKFILPLSRIAGQTVAGGAFSAAESASNNVHIGDAAKDILDNMAMGAGLGIGGEAVGMAAKGLRSGGKKVLSSLRGIRPESVSAYANNPKAVNEAIMQQMNGEFLPRFVEDTQAKVSEFVSNRTNQLDEILQSVDQPVSIKPLLDSAQTELAKLKGVVATPLRQKQVGVLEEQLNMLKGIDKKDVSASEVQDIKRQLQEQLQSFFESSPKKIKKDALDRAISNIEKAAVKTVEGIDPRIDKINEELKSGIDLQKKLKLGNVLEGGLDSEKARRFLGTLSNDSKSEIMQDAKALDELMGTNFVGSSTLFRSAKDLATQDVISTSLTGRSLLPIALGATTGGLFGKDPRSRGALGLAGALLAAPGATKPIISGGKVITDLMASPAVRGAVQRGILGRIREGQ